MNTSLPFVHTARRFFRLVLIVNCEESIKLLWMLSTGGRKSRNKVIVGEPAIGSLIYISVIYFTLFYIFLFVLSMNNSGIGS